MTERLVGEAPRVSVVVPHYEDLRGLDRCLTALAGQTYPRDRVEIIVADNASPVGEAAVGATVGGRAKLVFVAEKGAGPARNGGVRSSGGEILAFIDSDCVAEPEWLAEGVAALSAFDFVGGRVRVLVDDPASMTGPEAFERVFAFDFKTYIERKGFTGAGNMFCPRHVFDTVGDFRAGLSEDLEWSQRAVAAGFRLGYAPKAVVGHPARRTWDELLAKWRRVNLETFVLMKERGQRAQWFARALALPVSALVHAPRVLASPELETGAQRAAALAVLFRLRLWRSLDALRLLAEQRAV